MLTGTTSWTIGSTKAPPFITTFWPPRPVRTKARSFEDRRYSQFISHTPMATTIAATTSPRITPPNCAPVMTVSYVPRLTLPLTLALSPSGGEGIGSHRRIRLNFLVVSVSATSVGSRSMLEAP